jgi:HEAT repeat protein
MHRTQQWVMAKQILFLGSLFGWMVLVGAFAFAQEKEAFSEKSKKGPLDTQLLEVFACTNKTPKECPRLQAFLADPDPSMSAILDAVAQFQDDHKRVGAATVLGWLKDPAYLPQLFTAYKTSYSAVSKEAVVASVVRIGTPEVIPWLNKVSKTKDIGTMITMANAYGSLGMAEGVKPLLGMAKFYHPKVRAAAMNALGHIGDAEAVDPLLNILLAGEGKSNVEERALWALGKLKSKEAAPAILVMLFNDSVDVRSRAARVLGELKPKYMVPVLQSKLEKEDVNIVGEVSLAAARLGDTRLVPAMNWAAMNPHLKEKVRSQVFWAIGMMGDERSVPPLLALLKSQNQSLLILTIETLGNLGNLSAGPALLNLLEHNMLEVREIAVWSLEKLSGLQHGDDYAAWEDWLIEEDLFERPPP